MTTQFVFRAPTYAPRPDLYYQPSWMVRPYGKVQPSPPATKNIYYKPLLITQGHMGFLGTY